MAGPGIYIAVALEGAICQGKLNIKDDNYRDDIIELSDTSTIGKQACKALNLDDIAIDLINLFQ